MWSLSVLAVVTLVKSGVLLKPRWRASPAQHTTGKTTPVRRRHAGMTDSRDG
jgi:hypothetical protein